MTTAEQRKCFSVSGLAHYVLRDTTRRYRNNQVPQKSWKEFNYSMHILPSMIMLACILVSSLRGSVAVDSIGVSQSISDGNGTTLVSQDGTFELGFFSPGNSTKRYLGIWYKQVAMFTIVWVANRVNPINDTSGILTMDTAGNLVLRQHGHSVVWNATTQKQAQNPVAQLLDTGNLVVIDEGDANSQDFLWQSFDYPSDTLLPGMKVGWDLRRSLEWRITSWKSPSDPSPGDLSWGLKLNDYPDFYMKGKTTFFRFGPWNGLYFSGLPRDEKQNPIYEFRFVTSNNVEYTSNKDEMYYTFILKNSSVISRIVINETIREIMRLVWVVDKQAWVIFAIYPRDNCDVYNICGAYGNCVVEYSPLCQCLEGFNPKSPLAWDAMDWSEGCVRNKQLSCDDTFVKFVGLKVPDTAHTWMDENMGLEECRVRCLNNCSCMAYSNSDIRGAGSGCVMWFGDLIDMKHFNTTKFETRWQDLYIRMAVSESGSKKNTTGTSGSKKNTTRIIVATTILATCGMLLLCIYFICRVRRSIVEKSRTEDNIENHVEDLDLPLFDLPTITRATNNFLRENKIGQGGFGPVYKGKLANGQEIAVKRLSRSSGQGMIEFINEVKLIAKLQHRNLVKLLGCCIQGQEKLLIYEYMSNGSLDSFIFDHTKGKLINWPQRFHIVFGIARGLLYLHQDSRLRIIHRDLKASNVLLDNKLNPKISDFGMAKAFGGDQTEGNTNRVVGTYGYMAPEYAVDGLFSIKSDVFSFGILLLEIICGNRNRALYHANSTFNLVGYAWTLWKEGKALQLIDANIKDSCIDSEVLRCIHVSLICVQKYPEDMPTMASVLRMLESEMELIDPKEPGFFPRRDSNEANFISNQNGMNSNNGLTVTSLNGR